MTLQEKLRTKYLPSKRLVYDAIDTGTVVTLTAGTEYLLSIDGLVYEYTSDLDKKIYDTTSSIAKDSITDSVINFIASLEVYGLKDTEIELIIDVPAPVPEPIETLYTYIEKNNEYRHVRFNTFWYNGSHSSALEYGFRIKIKPIGNNVQLRNRSVKAYC